MHDALLASEATSGQGLKNQQLHVHQKSYVKSNIKSTEEQQSC
jgi:hypothetical protein